MCEGVVYVYGHVRCSEWPSSVYFAVDDTALLVHQQARRAMRRPNDWDCVDALYHH